ncbi:MAG: hypothetical protein J6L88_07560 [Clostridia bacterium]|nr:hypothetical protein [Clostridia bacterium]
MSLNSIFLVFFAVLAIIAGWGIARISAPSSKLNGLFVTLGITALVTIVCLLFISLFTFKIKVLLARLGVSIVCFLIGFIPTNRIGSKKTSRAISNTAVMKSALDICKEKNIVAVQVLPTELRFFDRIQKVRDCESWTTNTETADERECQQKAADFSHNPDNIPFAASRPVHVLRFADMNYPPLTSGADGLFAGALADNIPGFTSAAHFAHFFYYTVSGGYTGSTFHYDSTTGTGYASGAPVKKTRHSQTAYSDHVAYSKQALEALKQPKKAEEAPNMNSWNI